MHRRARRRAISDADFHVARLDCTDKEVPAAAAGAVSNKKFCENWGVDGFPTLYFVQGTLRWEYRGERTRCEMGRS